MKPSMRSGRRGCPPKAIFFTRQLKEARPNARLKGRSPGPSRVPQRAMARWWSRDWTAK